ncbi:putative kinesin [Leptomonas pyrrhocoris]|uniref:Putative kinesin n=1 Tax=Leptomonas pyrrhocoris TaxID=157538 RepID=A0A0M9FWP8_LEPPY|nr:putative kinesin [Leptomonas pyrrhocoris]KPA77507.1 putative kinesin [Leptomonas pyrrhocoris]|eukprot:XP_015655946.1 putative kinesin [Leptomonas pyrrhocoris]
MKVFCRFAPSNGPVSALDVRSRDAPLLLLRAEGQPLTTSATTTTGTRVHLADPVTLSKAAFSCDGVFLPLGTAKDVSARPQAQPPQQQQQQELLYTSTCRCLLESVAPTPERVSPSLVSAATARGHVPRRIYLAYGQTASGKTYSLFGEAPARQGRRDGLPPAAGVVPRYLFDVFRSSVFVDVSCFEVYNEVTTDLVALSTTLAAARAGSGVHRGRCGSARQPAAALQQEQASVWAAHRLYHDEQGDGEDDFSVQSISIGGSPRVALTNVSSQASQEEFGSPSAAPFVKTEYKATEKQQVLRSVERARCTSFSEAQAVLHALLTLRRECATSQNQRSSRGHLVFRVEVYTPMATAEEDGWVLQHETAFVDLAGSESGRLTEGDPSSLNEQYVAAAAAAAGHHRRRGRSSGPASLHNDSLLSTSRASSQHSRISHESSVHSAGSSRQSTSSNTSRDGVAAYHRYLLHPPQEEDGRALRARRLRETQCINASLLALRKVFRALYEATKLTRSYNALVSRHGAGLPRRPPLHHAPFKDSALTAILQPFLLPQAASPTGTQDPSQQQQQQPSTMVGVQVVLLVCCSSCSADFYETVASLRLGAEATAVNPEVVLRALPVQRREQQQEEDHRLNVLKVQGDNGGGFGEARRSRRTAAGPQPLFRSASAPNRPLLLLSESAGAPYAVDEHAGGNRYDDDDGDAASGQRRADSSSDLRGKGKGKEMWGPQRTSAAAATVPVPQPAGHTHGSGKSCSCGYVEEVTQLREEVQRYKGTAQQLYKQCKSLCESYDECVEELGKCRAAVAAKDAQIAELKRRLASAVDVTGPCRAARLDSPPPPPLPSPLTKHSNATREVPAGPSTPTRNDALVPPPRGTEGSSSPAARSPGCSSNVARSKQQLRQEEPLYEMGRISREAATAGRTAGAQAAVGTGTRSEGRGTTITAASARPSRSRGMTSSTAREESARCLVSLSPFSTASVTAVAAASSASAAVAGEAAEEREDEAAEDEPEETEGADEAKRSRERSAEDDLDVPPSSFSSVHANPSAFDGSSKGKENAQDVDRSTIHARQQQKARSIMNALLARQIFPLAEPHATALPSAPARENSPSPLLPTLTAHGTTATTPANTAKGPLQSVMINSSINPPCPSCRNARSSTSVPVHVGSSGATASSTTASEEAQRSSSGEGRVIEVEVEDATAAVTVLEQRTPSVKDSESAGRVAQAAAAAVVAVERAMPTNGSRQPQESAACSSLQLSADVQQAGSRASRSPTTSAQVTIVSMDRGEETRCTENEALREIVIAFPGSPAGRAAVNSQGSTRRSRSTVYAALLPPSPSRSPAGSRSPSLDAAPPSTCDVLQL